MRIIDADEYRKRIDHYPPNIRDIAKKELRYVKTIDAEPIIRCKDCFFCGEIDENGWHWCQNTGAGMPKDGFCSYAERKGWNWGR